MPEDDRKPFYAYGAHQQMFSELMCVACGAIFRGAWIHGVDPQPFIERCPGCGLKAAQLVDGSA
jgi:hypothetical protein